jgi:sugar phosphate permease
MSVLPEQATSVSTRPTMIRWHIVAILLAYSFMSWFNRVTLQLAYDDQIQDQYDISATQIGFITTTFFWAYTLCMTPGGWLVDRFGGRIALIIMGFGSALFCALTGGVGFYVESTMQLFWAFIFVRAGMGVFTAPIYPGSCRIVSRWIPFNQRAFINYHLFGKIIDDYGWERAFLISGSVTAIVAALWLWYGRDFPRQHWRINQAELDAIQKGESEEHGALDSPPSSEAVLGADVVGRPLAQLLRNRSLIFLTLSYGALNYFAYLFFFWTHRYFHEELHLDKNLSRTYATIVQAATVFGMIGGGWLSDFLQRHWSYRWGRTLVPVGGMFGGAVFLGLGLMAEEPGWVVVWFSLALAFAEGTEGPYWSTAIDLGGRYGATSAGIFNTGGNFGGALAPYLTALVGESIGWGYGVGLGSLVCLCGMVCWLWIDPRDRA